MSKPKTALLFEVAASYKADFYRRLLSYADIEFHLFFQGGLNGLNIKSCHLQLKSEYPGRVNVLSGLSFNQGSLIFQYLPIAKLLTSFDTLIVTGNIRDVSCVIVGMIAKICGLNVIIWNLAHSHRNNAFGEFLRLLVWRFFDNFLLYTPCCVSYLKAKGFYQKKLISINNGLDQSSISHYRSALSGHDLQRWRLKNLINSSNIILSCGRLNRVNAHDLVLQDFQRLINMVPDILWCIIGDGSQRPILEKIVTDLSLENHVRIVGEIYDEDQLAFWFTQAKLLVHPAPIGLSLLHAFGYGLPVITHDKLEEHGPEICYLKNGVNGILYKRFDSNSLSIAITDILTDKQKCERMSRNAFDSTNLYNTKVMAERTIGFIKDLQ